MIIYEHNLCWRVKTPIWFTSFGNKTTHINPLISCSMANASMGVEKRCIRSGDRKSNLCSGRIRPEIDWFKKDWICICCIACRVKLFGDINVKYSCCNYRFNKLKVIFLWIHNKTTHRKRKVKKHYLFAVTKNLPNTACRGACRIRE